jgi:hypothetical protein
MSSPVPVNGAALNARLSETERAGHNRRAAGRDIYIKIGASMKYLAQFKS